MAVQERAGRERERERERENQCLSQAEFVKGNREENLGVYEHLHQQPLRCASCAVRAREDATHSVGRHEKTTRRKDRLRAPRA